MAITRESPTMARQFEDLLDEDECCLECGTFNYRASRVDGLCIHCLNREETQEENDAVLLYSM